MSNIQNMFLFRFLSSLLIPSLILWKPVKTQEFISLMSSQNDDFCITNSSSAMYFTNNLRMPITKGTSFLPGISYFCDFENYGNQKCIDHFKLGVWDLAYSLNHNNTLLLDLRWERFPKIDLPYKISDETLSFLTLAVLKGLDYFKIPLSLIGKEAHLLLCDKQDVKNANCYWFVLQGWDQEYTALRKCTSGEISGLFPKGSCEKRIVQKKHPDDLPLYMNDEKWSHLIIEKGGRNLYLKLHHEGKEETIIHYSEEDKEMFKLNYLMGHRKDTKTSCKVHTNSYMRSTRVAEVTFDQGFSTLQPVKNSHCISLFLNTCSYCTTTVLFLDGTKKKVMFEKFIPATKGVWERHKIFLQSSSSYYMYVKLKTMLSEGASPTGEEFWSFDNVRDCHSEEYRITRNTANDKIEECRLIASDQNVKSGGVIKYALENSCPAAIGSACISCDIIDQRTNKQCENLKICVQKNAANVCYCAPGFIGPQCRKAWNDDDIVIKTTSDTVDIHLELPENVCPISTYTYNLKDELGAVLINAKALVDLHVTKLSTFTNYSIEFISKLQNISKNFRTQEGVPSEVKNLALEESTASYMKIHWKEPDFPKGIIEKYKVVFKKTRGISCTDTVRMSATEMNTTGNSVELNNLESHSEYEVTVFAINRLYQGRGSPSYFRTRGIDHFEDSEGLGQVTIRNVTAPKSAQITFDNVFCEKLLGPLNFQVNFRCVSKWCSDTEEHSQNLKWFRGTMVLKALQPYCQYRADIFICRNDKCELLEERTFETKASVPNQLKEIIVYAAGESFIWIRWLPPYPPTGKIYQYKITTVCSNCRLDHEKTTDVIPTNCTIWPDYYCHKLDQKIYYGYETSLTMEAANVENHKYVTIGEVKNIPVQENQSEEPYNLYVIWSPNNMMDLFWNHPNRTNGILKYFTVQIIVYKGGYNDVENVVEYFPQKFNLTYNYKFFDLPPAEDLGIQIVAVNNKYRGVPANLKESSYPASPDLVDPRILITNYTKTTISIALSVAQAVDSNSYVRQHLFVLIDDYSPEIKDPNLQKLEEVTKLALDPKSRLRVVAEVDLGKLPSKVFNFTIGEGDVIEDNDILDTKITNRPLEEAQYYNVSIVMLNEYRAKYRHAVYQVTALTLGDPKKNSDEEEDSSGESAAHALLLLLLPIVVVVVMK